MEWMYGRMADFSPSDAEAVYRDLTESRKNRIDRLKKPDDRLRSLLGEYLVKKLLASQYGVENAVIERAENGRPFLRDVPLYISISHSYDMVACAVNDLPVGIDVEKVKPIWAKLIDRVCVAPEKEYVLGTAAPLAGQVTDPEILARFYEIWTGKEAYFKAQGTGITDFKEVNVLKLERKILRVGEYLIQML